ncbi:MAG: hypothetical protein ACXWC2_05470 [Ramlibacter sp.]
MTASFANSPAVASSLFVGALLALASAGASAHDRPAVRHVHPAYEPAPQVVVVRPVAMDAQDAPRWRHADAAMAGACAAPGWDPRVRYMPGQVVWQAGSLWIARGRSASVWNENSPPEWTPSYWAPAVCG